MSSIDELVALYRRLIPHSDVNEMDDARPRILVTSPLYLQSYWLLLIQQIVEMWRELFVKGRTNSAGAALAKTAPFLAWNGLFNPNSTSSTASSSTSTNSAPKLASVGPTGVGVEWAAWASSLALSLNSAAKFEKNDYNEPAEASLGELLPAFAHFLASSALAGAVASPTPADASPAATLFNSLRIGTKSLVTVLFSNKTAPTLPLAAPAENFLRLGLRDGSLLLLEAMERASHTLVDDFPSYQNLWSKRSLGGQKARAAAADPSAPSAGPQSLIDLATNLLQQSLLLHLISRVFDSVGADLLSHSTTHRERDLKVMSHTAVDVWTTLHPCLLHLATLFAQALEASAQGSDGDTDGANDATRMQLKIANEYKSPGTATKAASPAPADFWSALVAGLFAGHPDHSTTLGTEKELLAIALQVVMQGLEHFVARYFEAVGQIARSPAPAAQPSRRQVIADAIDRGDTILHDVLHLYTILTQHVPNGRADAPGPSPPTPSAGGGAASAPADGMVSRHDREFVENLTLSGVPQEEALRLRAAQSHFFAPHSRAMASQSDPSTSHEQNQFQTAWNRTTVQTAWLLPLVRPLITLMSSGTALSVWTPSDRLSEWTLKENAAAIRRADPRRPKAAHAPQESSGSDEDENNDSDDEEDEDYEVPDSTKRRAVGWAVVALSFLAAPKPHLFLPYTWSPTWQLRVLLRPLVWTLEARLGFGLDLATRLALRLDPRPATPSSASPAGPIALPQSGKHQFTSSMTREEDSKGRWLAGGGGEDLASMQFFACNWLALSPDGVLRTRIFADVMIRYWNVLTLESRYAMLEHVIVTFHWTNIAAGALHRLKEEILQAHSLAVKGAGPADSPFLGDRLFSTIFAVTLRTPAGSSDLFNRIDVINASLNVLRFILVRDKQARLFGGIWQASADSDVKRTLLVEILTPLQKYFDQTLDNEAKVAQSDTAAKETVKEIERQGLPQLQPSQVQSAQQRNFTTLLLLRSLLAHVFEILAN